MATAIYDRIGGEPALKLVVDALCVHLIGDPITKPYFDGRDMSLHARYLRAFFTPALGGPGGYSGRPMDVAHAKVGVTDAAFDQLLIHLFDILTEFGIDPGTISEITGAVQSLRSVIVTK